MEYDLTIKKPVSVWNRELSIIPRDFFCSLGKAAISGAVSDYKGAADNLLDAIKDIALQDQPAYAAWLLVYKSLQQSLSELIKEYEDFFTEPLDGSKQLQLATAFETSLHTIEVGFDASFFDQPHKLPFLDDLRPSLIQWLMDLGMAETEANAFHLRLKARFVQALHKQWLEKPNEYACIEEATNSPFVQAKKDQRSWMQYNAWLQEQANERVFTEAFSLKQVYVPLRAYFEEKPNNTRIVVDLHDEVATWVRNFDKNTAVRIISGGPGSGKSSFGKMFSAYVAREIEEVPVLFIPLHHFKLSDDLTSAVEQFVRDDRYLTGSPLDASDGKDRLLIIFDGLDELSMQSKAAAETALYFVDEVMAKIDKFNSRGLQRQVLITGRDLAIQSASNRLRDKKQILHVLPYFVSEDEATGFIDDSDLLSTDQRDLWWKNYGCAKGDTYSGLPDVLRSDRLNPITKEPLLNYLIALSYDPETPAFSDDITLNVIYQNLLDTVHKREWDHGPHKGAKHLKSGEFTRILEEIALAVWHGDGRTVTVDKIFERCQNSNLGRYLEAFEEGAKKGVPRLLTAFYFRQSDEPHGGEKTFEFTHKSFGEYLTARRIVRSIKQIHSELRRHEEDPDTGFDEREALKRWAEICGPTAMDKYVFRFFCDEVAANPAELVDWQRTFARLLGSAVRNGMPMEQLALLKFKEMMRQSRNSEELLLATHYACAIKAEKVLTINWGEDRTAFGEWMKRIQGQRTGYYNEVPVLLCLEFIGLHACVLIGCDFNFANLRGANLGGADLFGANLEGADLFRANLRGANLEDANLKEASPFIADLEGSNLRGANLRGANLFRANLEGANLEEASLGGANLKGANLEGSNLGDANLVGANLEGANLKGANLEGANLEEANLKGADLKGANLEGADLFRADLFRADLDEASLGGANLEDANLKGADPKGAYNARGLMRDGLAFNK